MYHYNDKNFEAFFNALSGSEQNEIFKTKAIQRIIDFNYKLTREFTVKLLFIPYMMFLCLFMVYTRIVFEDRTKNAGTYILDLGCQIGLGLFAFYFFCNEAKQFWSDKMEYFTTIWNYLDIIPCVGVFTMIIMNFIAYGVEDATVTSRQIQAVTSLFMWLKVLYFLRIYKATGYYIHLISQTIFDMRFFALILAITVIAFGDAMYNISVSNPAEVDEKDKDNIATNFMLSYFDGIIFTYRAMLGDFQNLDKFDTSNGTYLLWGMFLLFTFFNIIVMLNLLISIVSDTFGQVNALSLPTAYQTMATLIAENKYLIPQRRIDAYAKEGQYLLVVTDLDNVEKVSSDPIIENINILKEEFTANINMLKDKLIANEEKL